MVARGEFGNNAAVIAVHGHLRMQGMREQAALHIVERNTGFVAGGFDAQDQHGRRFYPDQSAVDLEKA